MPKKTAAQQFKYPGTRMAMDGNTAVIMCERESSDAAGAYPITPSTEIAEHLSKRLPEQGGKFIQMEDEIASMCAIIGASLTGHKVMTATSGPGFSLMQEALGYAVMAEIPCVIVKTPVVAGVVGQERYQFDIWGDTVNMAARMMGMVPAGSVAAAEEIWTQVSADFDSEPLGEIDVKGKGPVSVYGLRQSKA